ncbi:2Fe-2S iron-sulfur cluster-binding protein [Paenibacillus pinistramenti]|uniref:2Fe-2S iron-sulfur cluster-binding protein n=1 Tax=Paenibacillus pinistramenti TaxID=1768003 RepID=UPI001107E838|nr:2Fe-2S iron-sulfur cluster-binding protein [Paenibacillus pinistramenti]
METAITFEPMGKTFKARPGSTVLQAALQHRISIPTRCKGMAGCLMCKVRVSPEHQAALTACTPAEERKLGPLLQEGVRLACQAKIKGHAVVTVPEDPLKAAIRKQLEAQNQEDKLW